jgi:hypothetical protein
MSEKKKWYEKIWGKKKSLVLAAAMLVMGVGYSLSVADCEHAGKVVDVGEKVEDFGDKLPDDPK